MKKLLLTVAVLLSPIVLEARQYGRYGRNSARYGSACGTSGCRTACPMPCATPRAMSCAPAECNEPTPPRCCKTIMVPETIQVPKVVEVPARRIVIPQPDVIEYIAQPPVEVRTPQPPIPQPDIISYRCVPDKIVHHKQPDCIRYECPADCD